MVLAVTRACRGSSSPGSICPSLRPTLPSFTEPLPLIMILALHSFSMFFSVFPLGTPGGHTGIVGDTTLVPLHPSLALGPDPGVVSPLRALLGNVGGSHTQIEGDGPHRSIWVLTLRGVGSWLVRSDIKQPCVN